MRKGRIYVLTSQSQIGFVKVGKTSRNPDERASELDGTALALPLDTAYEAVVVGFDEVERRSHELLEAYRSIVGREWFRCDVQVAISAICTAIAELSTAELVGEMNFSPQPPPLIKPVSQPSPASMYSNSNAPDRQSELPQPSRKSSSRSNNISLETVFFSMTARAEMRCEKCQSRFSVTVRRYEITSRCPNCFSLVGIPEGIFFSSST